MKGDQLVFLRCPTCAHQWHAATIRPSAWWAAGCSPEKIAHGYHCFNCDQVPPMVVVEETQTRLFD